MQCKKCGSEAKWCWTSLFCPICGAEDYEKYIIDYIIKNTNYQIHKNLKDLDSYEFAKNIPLPNSDEMALYLYKICNGSIIILDVFYGDKDKKEDDLSI